MSVSDQTGISLFQADVGHSQLYGDRHTEKGEICYACHKPERSVFYIYIITSENVIMISKTSSTHHHST